MKPPVCYWNPAKGNARAMLEHFAKGCGAEITPKLELQPGRIAVLWGVDRQTLTLWEEIKRTGHPYIYVDNGYFRSKWQGGDYYRCTMNATQHHGRGTSDGARWEALQLKIAPWRKAGRHILVACQSDFWHQRHGSTSALWFSDRVRSALKHYTNRPVVVRMKPIGGQQEPPLAEHLRDCWAVVTHSSMVATEALLAGVPAFMLSESALDTVALRDLSKIEAPYYADDRERWAGVLADNQWTLAEIRAGVAWRALSEGAR